MSKEKAPLPESTSQHHDYLGPVTPGSELMVHENTEQIMRSQWFEEYKDAQEKALLREVSEKMPPHKFQEVKEQLQGQKDLLDHLGIPEGSIVNAVRGAGIMEKDWMVLGVEGRKEDDYIIKIVKPPADLKAGRPSIYTLPFSLLHYWQTDEGRLKYLPEVSVQKEEQEEQKTQELEEAEEQSTVELPARDISFIRSLRIDLAEARKRHADAQVQKLARSQKVIEEVTTAIMKGSPPASDLRPKTSKEKRAAQRTSQLKRKSLQANIHRRELEEGFGGARGTRTPFIPRVDGNADQRHVNKEPAQVAGRYSDLGLDQQEDRLKDGTYTKSEQRQERKAAKKHKKAVHHQEEALEEIKHQREGKDSSRGSLKNRIERAKDRSEELGKKIKRLKRV